MIATLIAALSPFQLALVASLLAGLATGLGALPVFALRGLSGRAQGALLGFGAGVMLAAAGFSLLLPALEAAAALLAHPWDVLGVAAGVLLGGAVFTAANRWVPHEHFVKGREGADVQRLRRVWLFVLAIALHNFPEGLAVGVGFGAEGGPEQISNGIALAIGIALQNMPEGLVVALALRGQGETRGYAWWVALLTGLVEPLGALAGAGAVALSALLLPGGMAAAAGAMLYVISDEIIPESHRSGAAGMATQGLLIGFVLMMVLDMALT